MNQSNQNSTLDSFSYKDSIRLGLNVLHILGFFIALYALYWGFMNQIFTSEEALANLLDGFGGYAAFVFIGIQIIQTVVPIIPGGLTIPMGVIMFGMANGFMLNFVGIMIGSIINFWLARKLGRPIVEVLVNRHKFDKYTRWLEDEKRFEKLFTFGMFFPLSPADLLCYIAGLSKLSFSKYLFILSLGKPITLFIYSVGITTFLKLIFQFFS